MDEQRLTTSDLARGQERDELDGPADEPLARDEAG